VKYVLLSDIHGNLPALEAVAADFRPMGVDAVINLGDHLSGPLWPAQTLEFLTTQDWFHLRGNHDHQVASTDPESLGLSDAFAYQQISEADRSWLGQLPATLRVGEDLFAFHGTPASDVDYLLEDVLSPQRGLRSRSRVEETLGPHRARVFLCGHTHIPRCVSLDSGSLVINPGSVGLQAYRDDGPTPFIVENGSPHARYAVLEDTGNRWTVQFRLVAYDWLSAAVKARKEGRLDWETALRTGFVK